MKYEAFIVDVATLNISFDTNNKVHLSKKALIAYLKVDKASTKDFSQYTNFANIFSPKLAIELLKYISINNHVIKFVDN